MTATANVVFELAFSKLTPGELRQAIRDEASELIEKLAPAEIRTKWLNVPFEKDPTPQAVLEHVNKCLAMADSRLTASPLTGFDTYCWTDFKIICYFGFAVSANGEALTVTPEAGGLALACPLELKMTYVPE